MSFFYEVLTAFDNFMIAFSVLNLDVPTTVMLSVFIQQLVIDCYGLLKVAIYKIVYKMYKCLYILV